MSCFVSQNIKDKFHKELLAISQPEKNSKENIPSHSNKRTARTSEISPNTAKENIHIINTWWLLVSIHVISSTEQTNCIYNPCKMVETVTKN